MLKHRILSGSLFIALVLLANRYLWSAGVWLVLVALAAAGQTEFYAMVARAGVPVFNRLGMACGAGLITTTFLTAGPGRADPGRAFDALAMVAALIAVFIRLFPQKHNDKPLATLGGTLLGVWYVPFLLNFVTRLAFGWEDAAWASTVPRTGRCLCLYLIFVVKASDIGAYFVGVRFGRHKLFPRISPAKTWEGLAGGLGAGLAVSVAFRACTKGDFGAIDVGWADAAVLGLGLALAGTLGDICESLIKRATGSKDSSAAVPGMGGLLDVLDSLLFGAPFLYAYARVFL